MIDYKISVLVTFYNQENYVDKALSSIFSQKTNFRFCVIIGDDGSSDGTICKINNWKKKYPDIKVIVRDHNDGCTIGGFRASRNRLSLLEQVKTDYFIFLDGDDYFSNENKLQLQFDILESKTNRDCIACAHDIQALYSDGSIKPYTYQKVNEGKYEIKDYWRNYYFHTDTILFRSSLIGKLDFKLLENNYNDNMITFTALQFGKVYYIPKAMAVYNQTGDGIWTTGNQITNNIRNMFLYDLCNIINPQIKNITNIRFWTTWKNLLFLKKNITLKKYYDYLDEAESRKLKYSVKWLRYNEGKMKDKAILCSKSIFIIANACFFKIMHKLFKL